MDLNMNTENFVCRSYNNFISPFINQAHKVCKVAVIALALVVFAIAHPIIGPLGSLGFLLSAAYHGIALNYHYRHSSEKDKDGKVISGTELTNQPLKNPYLNENPGYTKEDLHRLEHESQRLYHNEVALDNLKWAGLLARCTIPIVGPLWAWISKTLMDIDEAESDPDYWYRMSPHSRDWSWEDLTSEEQLRHHISNLKYPK